MVLHPLCYRLLLSYFLFYFCPESFYVSDYDDGYGYSCYWRLPNIRAYMCISKYIGIRIYILFLSQEHIGKVEIAEIAVGIIS